MAKLDSNNTGGNHPETQQAILESALKVFAENGFDGATTRDIAARANVNHAMINYYFKNKEELWRHSVDHLFAKLSDVIALKDEDFELLNKDPHAFLRQFFSRYIRYCAKHPEHARIMIQESVRDSERLKWAAKKHIQSNHSDAGALVRIAVECGALPNVSPMALGYMIVGACQLIYALAPEAKYIWGRDVFDDDAIEEHIDAFCALFFRSDSENSPFKGMDGKSPAPTT